MRSEGGDNASDEEAWLRAGYRNTFLYDVGSRTQLFGAEVSGLALVPAGSPGSRDDLPALTAVPMRRQDT